ncbi:MAG: hypothetical protein ABIN39_05480 [candidate division WOR-3 bacterium]
MFRIFLFLLIFVLNFKLFSNSYEFSKIVDIGNSLKNLNSKIFITEIGFFNDDNNFTPVKIFDRNVKSTAKTDSLLSILYEDNFFEIYKIDSIPSLIFSESLDYTVEKILISKNYLLFKLGEIYYLYRYENDSLIKIKHFNLNSIDKVFSQNNNLLFITNNGEIIKYGKVQGDSFLIRNNFFVNNSRFLFFNRYSTIISNSNDKYLYFFVLRDDSLKLLYEVPDNRIYENGFIVDSFLILSSSDSLFIRTVIDSFITYSVDSFEFKDPVKDIVFENDTFYINTGFKIKKYSLISKSFKDSKVFSRSFKGFLRTSNKKGFFSDDSFYIFLKDSVIETKGKSKTLLKKENILLCYNDIIIPRDDSFKFFPINSYVSIIKFTDENLYFLDNNGFIKKLDLINDSIVNLFKINFNSNDFEKYDSFFYFISGQNGVLKLTKNGQFVKSYFDGSYFKKIFSFKNRLFTLKNDDKISIIDYNDLLEDESFYIPNYVDFYNYDDTMVVFLTRDSIILYKDDFQKVYLEGKNFRNLKDIIFDEEGVYILLKNCATLFFEKPVSHLKEDNTKEKENDHTFKNEEICYDILGRKLPENFKRKGLYFIKKGTRLKKMFKIK